VSFNWNIVTDLRAMWQWAFMRNAFEAGGLASIMAGIVGYLVVLRRSAFATHALGHGGFSGAAGAVVFGVNPIFGLLIATTAGGAGMALAGRRASNRDVEIGTILAFMLAIGLAFLSLYKGYASEAYNILFGEILGISAAQVLLTLEVTVAVIVALALVYRPLLFSSLDPDVAEAKGLPILALGLIFMLLLAVAISFSVIMIGVLLIFALMVTPAAAAVRLTQRPMYAVTASVLLALASTWLGLIFAWFASFYWPYPVSNFPASFFIVTIAFCVYAAVRTGVWVASVWVHPVREKSAADREATSEGA
jgi:zinc/manganese transport system permease protein